MPDIISRTFSYEFKPLRRSGHTLKPVGIGALSLLFIGAVSWLLLDREPVNTSHSVEVKSLKSAVTSTTAGLVGKDSTSGVETSKVIKLRQRIGDLKVELKELVAERSSAEALMWQAERDIASLERFIEEIEERGEDPVDYADEGLALFRPASDAYQDASDKLELAATLEQAVTDELAAAEIELKNIFFNSNTEQ
ncbi:MAG: hypothetical protein ACJASY_003561 [Halioglobus sp.]